MILLQRFRFLAMAFAIATCVLVSQMRADTLEIFIAADSDDAEEYLSNGGMFDPNPVGLVDIGSSDLELGTDYRSTEGQGPYDQLVGLRFENITIPAGSIINSASIQFQTDQVDGALSTSPASFDIFGELSVNPPTYQAVDFNISSRTTTTNSAQWLNVSSWDASIGSAGPDQETSDLSLIVQELIDQAGWSSGNAMAFQISAVAGAPSRGAEGGTGADSARLRVDYTIPEPSTVLLASFGVLMAFVGRRRSFC